VLGAHRRPRLDPGRTPGERDGDAHRAIIARSLFLFFFFFLVLVVPVVVLAVAAVVVLLVVVFLVVLVLVVVFVVGVVVLEFGVLVVGVGVVVIEFVVFVEPKDVVSIQVASSPVPRILPPGVRPPRVPSGPLQVFHDRALSGSTFRGWQRRVRVERRQTNSIMLMLRGSLTG